MQNFSSQTAPMRKILIADDSHIERLHLAHILEAANYQVIATDSGNKAKQVAESEQPDLIMLDIIMEDGDGYQACRAIRRNPVTEKTPIIMVSSKKNPVDKKWAERLGANAYVTKPYTDKEILKEINKIIY
ncbi:MAG: response regulator [bacterium]